jgi:broad specificity phosphatase PhoE
MAERYHLVRHGEVVNPDHIVYSDLPGFGLSAAGRSEARAAAARLAPHRVVAVVASPLLRARQTAVRIAAEHGVPVGLDERLTEWRLAIDWAGIIWEELPRHRPGELEAYLDHPWDLTFSPESLDELAARGAELARELDARYPAGDVVVVSHQDPVQSARLVLSGRSLRTLQQDKPRHASVTTLVPRAGWVEESSWAPDVGRSSPFPPV